MAICHVEWATLILPPGAEASVSEDAYLTLPEGWTELRFEREAFGSEGSSSLRVTAESESEDAAFDVLPVRFRRESGEETVRALDGQWQASRDDPSVPFSDVSPTTAFATRLTYTPHERERDEAICVAADAEDALAVAVWLAERSPDANALRRNVDLHSGSGSPSSHTSVLSDDEVLEIAFADGPNRCVLTGTKTNSHLIAVPYRYAPLLSTIRRTSRSVVRFPSTIETLVGAVSHDAWEEQRLGDLDFGAPLERVEPGRYRLPRDVVDAVAGADAEAFALRRLGEV